MAILKCKMCGGDLNIIEGETVAVCEYCDTKQTVPTADNEKKMTLFARANRLRAACEFDKAAGIYESIVADFPEEAEAYWGMLLCKFGIEYVDDPATGKKIPTCHRSSFESIMDDSDFEQVMENADPIARRVYREEAKTIEELRKNIIEVSSKEEPYDIFICYKETDENGSRTIDSVIAQDVYDALTEKGYRVFFSRITLEDKLGQEYEPYIFAALNSAKIMLAFGTDYEYYNAVWVKNEWSRFLALIAKGEKKTLIPCYKDIDAYDIPKEFRRLQAQDMGKVGAIQDLLRGIGKIIGTKTYSASVHTGSANSEAESMKQRGYMALEDGEIDEAKRFFERALDINPSDARAYLGKFLAQYGVASLSDFDNKVVYQPEENKLFKRAEQFADSALADELRLFKEANEVKVERLRLLYALKKHLKKMKLEAKKAEIKERTYLEACELQESGEETKLTEAAKIFGQLNSYKDSGKKAIACMLAYEEKKAAREEKKAAEVKQKAAEVKQKAVAVVAAFKAHCGEKREPTIEEKYAATKARIESLTALQNGFDALLALATQLRQEQAALASEEANISAQLYALTSQEKQLTAQRTKLGIFAGKEKKRIDGELSLVYAKKNEVSDDLSSLAARKRELDDRIRQNAQQRCGFDSMADIDREIAKENATASGLESQIASKRANEELTYNYEEAIKVYLGEPEVTRAVNTELYPTMYRNSIAFGRYIQKENGSPEPIEWRVLARENGRMLVISKYALDCQWYNTSSENVTWKTCSLRKWLNGAFLNAAFNSVEQNSIISSNDISSAATDKIFLLTQYQAREYFSSDKERQCQGTAYFKAKKPARKDNCEWWLGESGSRLYNAAYVNCDGRVVSREDILCGANYAVRPAMWIKQDY